MKRVACLLASCCILSLGSLTAFAKESAVRVPEDQITLTQSQTNFEATIEIEPEDAYAGVEIGIACPEGVTVTDSSGSSGSMSAGPVLARGLYWISYFESDNKLSGTMTITLQFTCPESFKSGDIQLETVKVLTKNGVAVDTEELSPALGISITRNGSGSTDSDPTDSKPTDSGSTTDTPSGDDTNPDTNTSSTENSSSIDGDIPQTGDNTHISMGMGLMFVSGCIVLGMILLVVRKKKFD